MLDGRAIRTRSHCWKRYRNRTPPVAASAHHYAAKFQVHSRHLRAASSGPDARTRSPIAPRRYLALWRSPLGMAKHARGGSRLVAMICVLGPASRTASANSAAASTTCSQVSITSNTRRPASAFATRRAESSPAASWRPAAAATAVGTRPGSDSDENSAAQAPSTNSAFSIVSLATSPTRLPLAPPGPRSVRHRVVSSAKEKCEPLRRGHVSFKIGRRGAIRYHSGASVTRPTWRWANANAQFVAGLVVSHKPEPDAAFTPVTRVESSHGERSPHDYGGVPTAKVPRARVRRAPR